MRIELKVVMYIYVYVNKFIWNCNNEWLVFYYWIIMWNYNEKVKDNDYNNVFVYKL